MHWHRCRNCRQICESENAWTILKHHETPWVPSALLLQYVSLASGTSKGYQPGASRGRNQATSLACWKKRLTTRVLIWSDTVDTTRNRLNSQIQPTNQHFWWLLLSLSLWLWLWLWLLSVETFVSWNEEWTDASHLPISISESIKEGLSVRNRSCPTQIHPNLSSNYLVLADLAAFVGSRSYHTATAVVGSMGGKVRECWFLPLN